MGALKNLKEIPFNNVCLQIDLGIITINERLHT